MEYPKQILDYKTDDPQWLPTAKHIYYWQQQDLPGGELLEYFVEGQPREYARSIVKQLQEWDLIS